MSFMEPLILETNILDHVYRRFHICFPVFLDIISIQITRVCSWNMEGPEKGNFTY